MKNQEKLLRQRKGEEHFRVTFIELFFDLVFVFAVTQLSHSLIKHFTLLGSLQTALLMLAVWWVWMYTSWVTNWLDPEKLPVRFLLLAIMLAGLILSSAIPDAFESRGLAFAISYVCVQVGRSLFMIWALGKNHAALRLNFVRITIWLAVAGIFWILGGFAQGEARLTWWLLALAWEYAAAWVGFWVPGLGRSRTRDWDVEGGHLAERCALFIIIALGESLLVTGASFSNLPWRFPTIMAFIVSFLGTLAMWWLYFHDGAEAGTRRISHSRDPGRIARLAYTYLHLFIVAGIVVAAVSDEFVLAHPTEIADAKTAFAVVGGAGLYLLGNTLFKWAITRRIQFSHLLGIAALVTLFFSAKQTSSLTLSAWTTAILIGIAAWEVRVRHWCFKSSGRGITSCPPSR